jgi:hypothetical protein
MCTPFSQKMDSAKEGASSWDRLVHVEVKQAEFELEDDYMEMVIQVGSARGILYMCQCEGMCDVVA